MLDALGLRTVAAPAASEAFSAAADVIARASAVEFVDFEVGPEVGALVGALEGEGARELVAEGVFDELGR